MDTSMIKRFKELEAKNTRLKKMYAEERIKAEIRKDALEGKLEGHLNGATWPKRRLRRMASRSVLLVSVCVSARSAIAMKRSWMLRINGLRTGSFG